MRRSKPLKTSYLRRKRPRYPSPAQERERREWGEVFDRCWLCRRGNWLSRELRFDTAWLETHEIASRAIAPGKWADVRSYFRTCRTCHHEILSWLPESVQMALKRMNDPANYDLSFINEIRGRADTAIENHEVENWCRFIKALRG